jgi:MFS family permease
MLLPHRSPARESVTCVAPVTTCPFDKRPPARSVPGVDGYRPDVPRAKPSTDDALDSARGWVMVGAAFASTFTVFGVAYSFGAFFESMSDEFGSGRGLTALFFSLTTFLYFTLGLFTGRWADRAGPRPVLLTGAVALGAGLLLTSAATSIWVGLATYSIGVGIAVACGYVPMVAVVGGWFERRRTAALGAAVAGIGAGTLVMSPTASRMIDAYGWRRAYVILGLGGAAVLVACALVVARPPIGTTNEPAPALRDGIVLRSFRSLYASTFLLSLALFVPFVFLTSYAEDEGVAGGLAAALVGWIGAASIVGRLGLGAIAPRVGLVRLYQSCFAVMALSFLIWLAAGDRYWVLVSFTIVLGVAYGGFIALAPAVTAAAFGPQGLGAILGAVYTAAGVGGLVGPPLAGAMIDAADGYSAAILAAAVITFAAFGVLARIPPTAAES